MPLAGSSNAARLFGDPPRAGRRKMIGRMGAWQLVSLLGEGAMTRVYLARPLASPDAPPAYAVKALKKEWWQDAAAVNTMRREVMAARQVNHPGLTPVLSAHVGGPPFYLVTPRLVGETVADRIAAGRRFPVALALWIARQATQSMEALHRSAGLIHGDIKPANLFVSADGHATLLDLGFSRAPGEENDWTSRPVLGTLQYLAPELVTSAGSAGPASDLYSLGVTLHEMLAGRPPFVADSPAELIGLHREAKPTPLDRARPDTPPAVADLVRRLLSKDPLRRHGSHAELIDALTRLEITCFAA